LIFGLVSRTFFVSVLAEAAFALRTNLLALVGVHFHLGLIDGLIFGCGFSELPLFNSFFPLSLFVLLLFFPLLLLSLALGSVDLLPMFVPASLKVCAVLEVLVGLFLVGVDEVVRILFGCLFLLLFLLSLLSTQIQGLEIGLQLHELLNLLSSLLLSLFLFLLSFLKLLLLLDLFTLLDFSLLFLEVCLPL
jgi:hypothetical protein